MILQPVEHPEFLGGKRREGESLEMLYIYIYLLLSSCSL